MELREIKPGMAIRCANKDEYKKLNEETIKKGFGELPCSGANCYGDKCFYISADGIGWSYLTDDGELPRGKVVDLCELIIEEDEYNRGLNDAWMIFKKLLFPVADGGISLPDMYHIFGTSNCCEIVSDWDVKDVLAKLEAYEKEQENPIIGDIVLQIDTAKEFLIITEETDDDDYDFGVIDLKHMRVDRIPWGDKNFIKTGKHIDISALLAEIGKE